MFEKFVEPVDVIDDPIPRKKRINWEPLRRFIRKESKVRDWLLIAFLTINIGAGFVALLIPLFPFYVKVMSAWFTTFNAAWMGYKAGIQTERERRGGSR